MLNAESKCVRQGAVAGSSQGVTVGRTMGVTDVGVVGSGEDYGYRSELRTGDVDLVKQVSLGSG